MGSERRRSWRTKSKIVCANILLSVNYIWTPKHSKINNGWTAGMSKIKIYHFLRLESKLELLWTIFTAAFFRIGILKRLDNDHLILSYQWVSITHWYQW